MKQLPMLDNRYQVVKKLSAGGFGVTYLAKDTRRPGHPLCVAKELRHEHQNSPKILQLFHQEAEMLERLGEHEQIPKLLAAFSEANRWYLIQEYINGVTLTDELLAPNGQKLKKSESEVMDILRDVLAALVFVHQHNVVHRDIKPANLVRRRKDGKIMLIDFGAVKELTGSQINQQGKVMTSICVISEGYSPYEQVFYGKAVAASDIYALGATAIEALTGRWPQDLKPDTPGMEWRWRQHCQVSDSLAAFLSQMVRVDCKQRFQNAEVALAAWKSLAAVSEISRNSSSQITMPPPLPQPHITSQSRLQSQTLHPNPSVQKPVQPGRLKRRDALKFLGFSAGGILMTLAGQQLLQNGKANRKDAIEDTGSSGTWYLKTVQVNAEGEVVARPEVQVQYFDEPYLIGKLKKALPLRMVKIPAGEIELVDDGLLNQRKLSVSSFSIGAFEITQRQFTEVMGYNPSHFPETPFINGSDRPVEGVSWWDAQTFCKRLSDVSEYDYRLPSEVEWEYACRAGTTTPFAFGETITTEIVNYQGERTVKVDAFSPNAFGLFNMHGNVYEWCQDEDPVDPVNESCERSNLDSSDEKGGGIDPLDPCDFDIPDTLAGKVLRGGHYHTQRWHMSSGSRAERLPEDRSSEIGFRVVCSDTVSISEG